MDHGSWIPAALKAEALMHFLALPLAQSLGGIAWHIQTQPRESLNAARCLDVPHLALRVNSLLLSISIRPQEQGTHPFR